MDPPTGNRWVLYDFSSYIWSKIPSLQHKCVIEWSAPPPHTESWWSTSRGWPQIEAFENTRLRCWHCSERSEQHGVLGSVFLLGCSHQASPHHLLVVTWRQEVKMGVATRAFTPNKTEHSDGGGASLLCAGEGAHLGVCVLPLSTHRIFLSADIWEWCRHSLALKLQSMRPQW